MSRVCLEIIHGAAGIGHQTVRSPDNRGATKLTRSSAFTLIEILIVVTLIGVISAIALPSYVRARTSTQVKACISNLQKIDGAKGQWAIEMRRGNNDIPTTADIVGYLNDNRMPPCPANGNYRIRRVCRIPTCSLYSIGHTVYNLNMDDDPNVD